MAPLSGHPATPGAQKHTPLTRGATVPLAAPRLNPRRRLSLRILLHALV